MRFLCDAHISYKIVNHLISLGFDAMHVNEMHNKWFTKDREICAYADANDLIIITKDSDFRNSFFINNSPNKLIKINLGNISTQDLIQIISNNIASISKVSKHSSFLIEIDKTDVSFIIGGI